MTLPTNLCEHGVSTGAGSCPRYRPARSDVDPYYRLGSGLMDDGRGRNLMSDLALWIRRTQTHHQMGHLIVRGRAGSNLEPYNKALQMVSTGEEVSKVTRC